MAKPKYQIGAVVYDEDLGFHVKADIHHIGNAVKWGVYENGNLEEVFDTNDEAKRICLELREDAKHLT